VLLVRSVPVRPALLLAGAILRVPRLRPSLRRWTGDWCCDESLVSFLGFRLIVHRDAFARWTQRIALPQGGPVGSQAVV
jgi:hypothetical protein